MDKRLVKSQEVKGAKVVIVGEAPGAQEERTGMPFVGPAGELLSRCLQKAGLCRSRWSPYH
jgi:DNA polymerase